MAPLNLPLASGELGSASLTESSGVFMLSGSSNISVGGGSLKGAVILQAQIGIGLSAIQLGNAGLAALSSLFPQFSAEIALIQAALDAEAAKL